MRIHRQYIIGMIVVAGLLAAGYVTRRDTSGSMLASIVGGVEASSVRYERGDQNITLYGMSGGSIALEVVMLYDPTVVSLVRIDSDYQYVSEDNDGIVRLSLSDLPGSWSNTQLLQTLWSGSLESVVMSDIFTVMGDSRHALRVESDAFCLDNNCR